MDIDGNPRRGEVEMETIQAEIDHLKQRHRLLLSEERAVKEAQEDIMKRNAEQIRNLQKDIDWLHVILEKGKVSDEKTIKKAFHKFPSEMGLMKNKNVDEVIDILEDRVFDLTKKRDELLVQIKQKENTLQRMKADLKDIERRCQSQDEECDENFAEKLEDVHIDYEEVKTRVSEMQNVEKSYQNIVQNLTSNILTMPMRLDLLENEYNKQQAEIEQLLKREERAGEFREKAVTKFQEVEAEAFKSRQEKDRIDFELNKMRQQKPSLTYEEDMKRASTKTTLGDELNKMKKEQESQLNHFKEAFEEIKIATGVTDIEDAEKRFTSQMAIKENLIDLKNRSQKMLMGLKKAKERFESQKQMMLNAGLANPEQAIEDKLADWEATYEEQSKRKETAYIECKRVSKTVNDIKISLWQLLQLMEHHLYGYDMIPASTMPDMQLPELVKLVKNMLEKVMNDLENHNINGLIRRIKKEQPFIKDLENGSFTELSEFRRPKLKPGDMESSSDEEEEEAQKRNMREAKKEDRNFATLKEKQKGKGRTLKL